MEKCVEVILSGPAYSRKGEELLWKRAMYDVVQRCKQSRQVSKINKRSGRLGEGVLSLTRWINSLRKKPWEPVSLSSPSIIWKPQLNLVVLDFHQQMPEFRSLRGQFHPLCLPDYWGLAAVKWGLSLSLSLWKGSPLTNANSVIGVERRQTMVLDWRVSTFIQLVGRRE